MKQLLLSLCFGTMAIAASADVYTFIAADAAEGCYAGEGQLIVLPEGFYTTRPVDRKPVIMTSKAMVSDQVMIKEIQSYDANGDTLLASNGTKVEERNYVTSGGFRWYEKRTMRFTPAAGVAITGIRVLSQSGANKGALSEVVSGAPVAAFTVNASNELLQEWTGSNTKAMDVYPAAQNRCFWIEVTTEGTSTQVNLPVSSVKTNTVAADEAIELTCSTPGAKIYYTVSYDNSTVEPTTESTLYTAPFKLEKDAIVRAIAVKDGMTQSFPVYYEYYVVPNGLTCAAYDFSATGYKSLNPAVTPKEPADDSSNGNLNISGKKFTDGTAVLEFSKGKNNTMSGNGNTNLTKSGSFGKVMEVRTAWTATATVTVPEGMYIHRVLFVGSKLNRTALKEGPGVFSACPTNTSKCMWVEGSTPTNKVVFVFNPNATTDKNAAANDAQYVDQVYVYYSSDSSGVDAIEEDMTDANAPVEYYNLQGVRVANPANGIYIKRQGNKAEKIYMR